MDQTRPHPCVDSSLAKRFSKELTTLFQTWLVDHGLRESVCNMLSRRNAQDPSASLEQLRASAGALWIGAFQANLAREDPRSSLRQMVDFLSVSQSSREGQAVNSTQLFSYFCHVGQSVSGTKIRKRRLEWLINIINRGGRGGNN
jgi:hypothetical protein